ncbi:MAG: long-chain fatty acid--CoA ligase [Nitrospinae bacterium]|nr:long-chain fatty acid--CoA ligase [Nitrospinota bacterium]
MSANPYADLPTTVEIPDRPVTALLDDAVARFPERVALSFFGVTLTYRQLDRAVDRAVNVMRERGHRPGDPVAILTPNSPHAVILYQAVLRAGGIVVMLNPLLVERELLTILTDCRAKIAFVSNLFLAKIDAIQPQTPLASIVVLALDDYMPWLTGRLFNVKMRLEGRKPLNRRDATHTPWKSAMAAVPDVALRPPLTSADTALYLYTSGTTGAAKAVELTHANVLANAYQCGAWFVDATPGEEVFLLALPLFHAFGMTVGMNTALRLGATMVLTPKFDAGQVMKLVAKHRVTMLPGVPAMYHAINHHPDAARRDLSSVRYCISGAATLPKETKETFEKLTGGTLVEGYGLSEASPCTHCNPLRAPNKEGSIGLPLPNTAYAIVAGPEGEEVPAGEIGELIVKGPQVMKGYHGRPADSDLALKNGWLFTGDMGYRDADGFVYLMDRKKELVITGGCNVYPREVEEALYRIDGVVEAAVVGMPDDYLGEQVVAAVVVRPDAGLTEASVIARLKEDLAGYKVPKRVRFLDTLPKTVIGKVLKRQVKEEMMKG